MSAATGAATGAVARAATGAVVEASPEVGGQDAVRLRSVRWPDLARLAELDAGLFAHDAWPEATWWAELAGRPRRDYVLAEGAQGEVLGYAGVDLGGDTADVMTVAVVPAARRRGWATGSSGGSSSGPPRRAPRRCCWRCAPTTHRRGGSTRGTGSSSCRSAAATTSRATSTPSSCERCCRRREPIVADEPLVLGIETSCDETGVGIVRGGTLLVDAVASSVDEHARFGGVVPEVASRAHLEAMVPTIERACRDAGVRLADLDAIAVTSGPGLAGALVVGVRPRRRSPSARVPLYGVNHLASHVAVDVVEHGPLPEPTMALLVSGGHSSLLVVPDVTADVRPLGSTIDDAAGRPSTRSPGCSGCRSPAGRTSTARRARATRWRSTSRAG